MLMYSFDGDKLNICSAINVEKYTIYPAWYIQCSCRLFRILSNNMKKFEMYLNTKFKTLLRHGFFSKSGLHFCYKNCFFLSTELKIFQSLLSRILFFLF